MGTSGRRIVSARSSPTGPRRTPIRPNVTTPPCSKPSSLVSCQPLHEADVVDLFRLSTAALADPADRRTRRERCDRRPRRPSDARPARHPPRDGRRRAGGAARSRRAAPRVRAVDGGRTVRSHGVRSSCRRPTTSAPRTCAPNCWPSPRAAGRATLLEDYTDAAIDVADAVPGTGPYREAVANVAATAGRLVDARRPMP